jgi:hypothetical protein
MRKPKGYWLDRDNCIKAIKEVAEAQGWTEVPTQRKCIAAGMPDSAIRKLGGREALAEILGLPLTKSCSGMRETYNHMEKWEGKPSNAFQIEKEAREKGMRYADIQKAKTLAMVGGVQI